jgi:hypothetical protein
MATTTNYGWTTPDDTALVKDGAAAIRTLGSSIDTTTKNLNPETTLGDLAYRSSTANVKTRLALGTANQQLRVNAGATAPEWFTPTAAGGMTLLATHTLSGSTSTISSISGSYKSLFGVITGAETNGSGANWRIDPNGSNAITNTVTLSGYATVATGYHYVASWYLNINAAKTTGGENCWSFTIDNYASTTGHKPVKLSGQFIEAAGTDKGAINNGGGIRTNSAITSLDFVTLSGSWTAGTVLLYGVN